MPVDCFGFRGGCLRGFATAGCVTSCLTMACWGSEDLVTGCSVVAGLVVSGIINEYN